MHIYNQKPYFKKVSITLVKTFIFIKWGYATFWNLSLQFINSGWHLVGIRYWL